MRCFKPSHSPALIVGLLGGLLLGFGLRGKNEPARNGGQTADGRDSGGRFGAPADLVAREKARGLSALPTGRRPPSHRVRSGRVWVDVELAAKLRGATVSEDLVISDDLAQLFGLTEVEREAIENEMRAVRERVDAWRAEHSIFEVAGEGEFQFFVPAFDGGEGLRREFEGQLEGVVGREGADLFMQMAERALREQLGDFGAMEQMVTLQTGSGFVGVGYGATQPLPAGFDQPADFLVEVLVPGSMEQVDAIPNWMVQVFEINGQPIPDVSPQPHGGLVSTDFDGDGLVDIAVAHEQALAWLRETHRLATGD